MKNANLRGLLLLLIVAILFTGCFPPLHTAAMDGDAKKVKKLLDEGANVNEWSTGTPLLWASTKGNLETVKLLAERGADLDMRFKIGHSPLGNAVKENKTEVVKYLIIQGASVDEAIKGLNDLIAFCSRSGFSCTEENQKAINDLKNLELQALMEKAMQYNQKGEYNKAADILKRLIAKSQHQDYYASLAYVYRNLEQYEDGIVAAKMSIEIKPNAYAYSALGSLYNAQKQYNEAIKACKKGIELNPKSHAYYELFQVYSDQKDYDNAIKISKQASEAALGIGIDLKPSLALLYYQLGRYDEAIANTTANTAKNMALRSLAYRQKGDFEKALNDAKAGMELDSSDSDVLLAIGAVSLDRGEYNEAIRLLSQVKDNSTATLLKATALIKSGRTEDAVQIYASMSDMGMSEKNIPFKNDFQALLQVFKPIVLIHRDKAKFFEEKNMDKEMLTELSVALQIADGLDAQAIQEEIFRTVKKSPLLAAEVPEEARRYALRGEIFVKEGKLNQAIMEFKKAIRIAPYVARLYSNTALVCAEIKNYPEAIRNMNIYLKVATAPDVRAAKDKIIEWELLMDNVDGIK